MDGIPTITVTPTSDNRWQVSLSRDIVTFVFAKYESEEKAIEAAIVIQEKHQGCLKIIQKFQNISFLICRENR